MVQTKKEKALAIVAYLKKTYPRPKTELRYKTHIQCLVAVMLSAQYTDKKVNELTETLFKKYKTVDDFANASVGEFARDIRSVSYYNNKARHIVATAKMLNEHFGGKIPRTVDELVHLPGVGRKTANVVLGELFDIWEGIAVDTHVRRFALRFGLTEHTDSNKIAKDLEELIPKKDWKYVNNGFVLYGRYVCPARKHNCINHPLTKLIPEAADIWVKSK